MRLGETNFNDTVDCEGEVCADAPIEIPVESAFSRYDEHWRWADNIGLIVLSIEVIYSSKLPLQLTRNFSRNLLRYSMVYNWLWLYVELEVSKLEYFGLNIQNCQIL